MERSMEIPKAGQTVFFLGGPRFVATRGQVIRTDTGKYAVCTVKNGVVSSFARANIPIKLKLHDDGTYENADFKSLMPRDVARWAWDHKTAKRTSHQAFDLKARFQNRLRKRTVTTTKH
jgi:hypothetical protein